MWRHSVMWILRDTVDDFKLQVMIKGIAYVRMEAPSMRAADYGLDLFGGAKSLRELPPYKRRPRWRDRMDGPPCNYDLMMHLDFDDHAGYEDYRLGAPHKDIAVYNDTTAENEFTARVEWEFDPAESPLRRGHVRHTAMFIWSEEATEAQKQAATDAARRLGDQQGVESLAIGYGKKNHRTTEFDWILDVHLPDPDTTQAFLEGPGYREAMSQIAGATKYEWTARASHLMRGV